MTTQITPFDTSSLFKKAKVFVDRLLKSSGNSLHEEAYIWASLSLELLAKSTLSNIHPVLVIDAEDTSLLLHIFDLTNPKTKKTISAGAAYDRLKTINPSVFTEKIHKTCIIMAAYRNSEIHSGEINSAAGNYNIWIVNYWMAIVAILKLQNKDLKDLLDLQEDIEIVDSMIAKKISSRSLEITKRISNKKNDFNRNFPPGSREREIKIHKAEQSIPNYAWDYNPDDYTSEICPACGSDGCLLGHYESNSEPEIIDEYTLRVTITYNSFSFVCKACELLLESQEEIEIAKLPQSFELEETPNQSDYYYEDYGND